VCEGGGGIGKKEGGRSPRKGSSGRRGILRSWEKGCLRLMDLRGRGYLREQSGRRVSILKTAGGASLCGGYTKLEMMYRPTEFREGS